MNKYFVYILKSDLNFHYIGQTSNLVDRFSRHNSNRNTYNKNNGHWEVAASIELQTRLDAVQLE